MDIVIHGTKDGYRTLFSSDTKIAYNIAKDLRKGARGDEQLGKKAYSLAYLNNGCVFTKFIIVKDSIRSFATGTIAFSIFLGEDESMKAEDVIRLLNELYDFYQLNYIKNYCLNKGETTLIREDWSFVKQITNEYKIEPQKVREEDFNSGTKEAAYIYYDTIQDLLQYFEKPFQEEYTDFTQVFFIQRNLQGVENPLNVLKNSGVEIKAIDLNNKHLFLNNFNPGRGLTITANGKKLSDRKNHNRIKLKDKIILSFNKDERYYKAFVTEGILSDPNSDIYNYLEVKDDNNIIIKWDALETKLNNKPNTITFIIKDRKGNVVEDAIITCKSGNKEIPIRNGKATFNGEEYGNLWIVSAKKSANLYSSEKTIIPESDNPVELFLDEYKQVTFKAKDSKSSNQEIKDFVVKIKGYNQSKTYFFKNNDIERKHEVLIQADEYQDKTIKFRPSTDESIINLKKKSQTSIKIPEFLTKPKNIIAVSASVAVLLILFVVSYLLIGFPEKKSNQFSEEQIRAYAEGVDLNIDSLNKYKDYITKQNKSKPKSSKFNPMRILKSESDEAIEDGRAKTNSENDNSKTQKAINKALEIRGLINDYQFEKLKKYEYSKNQEKFESAIGQIDSASNINFKSKLRNIKSLNLNQIADSIDAILKPKTNNKENINKFENEETKNKESEHTSENPPQPAKQSIKPESNSTSTKATTKENVSSSNNASMTEIEIKLKGGDITKKELQTFYDDPNNEKYRKSIKLYIDFWSTIKVGMQMDDSKKILKEIESDKYLKNSQLKVFLKAACTSSETFQKYNDTPGKQNCKTISELNNKVKL